MEEEEEGRSALNHEYLPFTVLSQSLIVNSSPVVCLLSLLDPRQCGAALGREGHLFKAPEWEVGRKDACALKG